MNLSGETGGYGVVDGNLAENPKSTPTMRIDQRALWGYERNTIYVMGYLLS